MLRNRLLMFAVLAGTWGNAGPLFAETMVVVGAGIAEEPGTGNQFEFSVAAVDGDDAGASGISSIVRISQLRADQGAIDTVHMEIAEAKVIIDRGTGRSSAELAGFANVKLFRGRRYPRVPAFVMLAEDNVQIAFDLGRDGVVELGGEVFSGGNSFGVFEPAFLVVALGEGTTVESTFQAAAAIGNDGRAMGRLSLLANRDNGDLVRVEGVVDGAAVRPYVGRKRLQLHLAGVAAVDVFRPDNTSPDTCFGDFTFVANEGPHGPFRIDVPDCGDPLAGIEGSDIGSGAVSIAGS